MTMGPTIWQQYDEKLQQRVADKTQDTEPKLWSDRDYTISIVIIFRFSTKNLITNVSLCCILTVSHRILRTYGKWTSDSPGVSKGTVPIKETKHKDFF